MHRRRFLATAGLSTTAALAGCLGAFETTTSREPPLVENRPDAVYLPSHSEGMLMAGSKAVGDLRAALTYSFPHRFWTVEQDGDEFATRMVEIRGDDALHLMTSVWVPDTEVVVPNTGLSVEILRDGDLVSEEVIYPMLSQRMGFHYGANFSLDGDAVYDVRVSVGGLSIPRYGGFEGRFADPASAAFELDYREERVNGIAVERFDDRAGDRDAVSPMEMGEMPVGRVPDPFPGEALGAGTLGDLGLVAGRLTGDRFGADPYLAVGAHTPYNRLAVPGAGLSARVERGGEALFDDRLSPALDSAVGFHYGASVPDLAADDAVTARVDTPPQVARHEGYETAFLRTGAVELTR